MRSKVTDNSENTGHWQVKERTVSPNTKPESRICGPGEPRRELQEGLQAEFS